MTKEATYDLCVSCGKEIPLVPGENGKGKIRGKHTCSTRHDSAQKSAHTKAYDDVPTRRKQSLLTRLKTGFEMIAAEEDGE